MGKIATVTPREDFIVQMNGDYNIVFDELKTEAKVAANTYVEVLGGITAKAAEAGEFVRVMVRGNPTTVNAQRVDLGSDAEAAKTALAAKGIIVVNE